MAAVFIDSGNWCSYRVQRWVTFPHCLDSRVRFQTTLVTIGAKLLILLCYCWFSSCREMLLEKVTGSHSQRWSLVAHYRLIVWSYRTHLRRVPSLELFKHWRIVNCCVPLKWTGIIDTSRRRCGIWETWCVIKSSGIRQFNSHHPRSFGFATIISVCILCTNPYSWKVNLISVPCNLSLPRTDVGGRLYAILNTCRQNWVGVFIIFLHYQFVIFRNIITYIFFT